MSSMSFNHNMAHIIHLKFSEPGQDFVSTSCYIRTFLLKNISLGILSNVYYIAASKQASFTFLLEIY